MKPPLLALFLWLAGCSAEQTPFSNADRAAANIAAIIDAHDKNRDGELSLTEWHASGPLPPDAPNSDERARWAEEVTAMFKELDGDGDGHVSITEYQARVRADVMCLDQDGDGRLRDEEVSARLGTCAASDR